MKQTGKLKREDESLFLNLFDFHLVQQMFIQLLNSHIFYEDSKDCYSDCSSLSSTSKLFNSVSKQTQFSIKIFQNQKIEDINYNIYLKLYYILQQDDIKNQNFNSKQEILTHTLIFASKNGIYNLIQPLISNGANPNYEDHQNLGYTPLFHSCKHGHYKTTKLLILNNYIHSATFVNDTILHKACESNNLKLVQYLVNKGFNIQGVNYNEETPLFNACSSGNLDIVKYLVNRGSKVHIQNTFKENLLFDASRSGNIDLVKYLIVEKKVNINHKDDEKRSILFGAIHSKNIEVLDYLISLGLNLNWKDKRGETLLYVACKRLKNLEIINYLISKGADLAIKYEDNKNILEIAKNTGNQDIIKQFEKYTSSELKDGVLIKNSEKNAKKDDEKLEIKEIKSNSNKNKKTEFSEFENIEKEAKKDKTSIYETLGQRKNRGTITRYGNM